MKDKNYNPKVYNDNDLKNKSGIYQIRNLVDNKLYIGSAVNFKRRKYEHLLKLKRNKHNKKFQNAFNKYGEQNFVFEVIEFVEDKNKLLEHEQYWMDRFNVYKNGYNATKEAGNTLGLKLSNEAKDKLRKANLGKKLSEETKRKISETLKSKRIKRANRKLTEETKRKISEKLKLHHSIPENNCMFKRKGELNPKSIKIIRLKDGKIFNSLTECAEMCNTDRGTIIRHCKNRLKSKKQEYSYYLDTK